MNCKFCHKTTIYDDSFFDYYCDHCYCIWSHSSSNKDKIIRLTFSNFRSNYRYLIIDYENSCTLFVGEHSVNFILPIEDNTVDKYVERVTNKFKRLKTFI